MNDIGQKLRGRVDSISMEKIQGWAFDENDPESHVDISVYVDDQRVAQVRCDVMRRDLLAAGTFGSVGHGFEHRFQPPLDISVSRRVTARFVGSGRRLDRGDMMLPEGAEPSAPDFGQTLPGAFPVLPGPKEPRDWFNLLTLLEDKQGLYNLVARCDMSGRRIDQILYSVYGDSRPPTPKTEVWNPAQAREIAYQALTSQAFQKAVKGLVLNAFPEKKRRFFIHVPKCAGTDLSAHLSVRFPAFHQSLTSRDYSSQHRLFGELSELVRILPFFDFVLVHGHMNLGDVLGAKLLRPVDEMFTTLRNPIDISLSQTNYILTRLMQDAERGAFGPDSRTWLLELGLDVTPAEVTRPMLDALRLPLLRDGSINRPDTMCEWLGGGEAAEVVDRLSELDAEVTTTRHYGGWLAGRWQIQSGTRRNESVPFLRREDLTPGDLDYLYDISIQDRQLYAEVEKRIDDAGSSWVFMGCSRLAG